MLKIKAITPRHIVIVLGMFGVAAATSISGQEADKAPLQCGLEMHQQANYVRLKGWVVSSRARQGEYKMHIHKSAGGGTSTISQSGDFTLAAGKTQTLSTSVMNGTTASIKAELNVTWHGQVFACTVGDAPSDL